MNRGEFAIGIFATMSAAVGVPILLVWLLAPDLFYGAINTFGTLAIWTLRSFLALAGGSVLFFAVILWRRQTLNHNRQQDGSFALRRLYMRSLPGRAWDWLRGRQTPFVEVVPDNVIGPGYAVDHTGIYEIPSVFGADRQTLIRAGVQATRTAQAIFPGDRAIADRHGAMFRAPSVTNGAAKAIGESTGKNKSGRPELPPEVPAEAPAPEPISLRGSIMRSTPDRWIVGQDRESGAVAEIEPAKVAHIGIIGSTGTGKTSGSGFHVAVHALRSGHVVILDPDYGADWGPFRTRAEYYETDAGILPDQIRQVRELADRRRDLLGEHGAGTISQLPDGIRPAPVFVFVEEYGSIIREIRAKSSTAGAFVDNTLDRLLERSRKLGIHFVFLDQYPEAWSNSTIANVKARIVYQLGPNQGSKVSEYKAHELPDRGRFLFRGRQYDSWHVAPQLAMLLQATPATAPEPVLAPTWRVRSDGGGEGFPSGSGAGERPNERTPANGPTVHVDSSPEEAEAETAGAGWTNSGWADTVERWFQANPGAMFGKPRGISDLARHMAHVETGIPVDELDPEDWQNYKGIAHELFHAFRRNVSITPPE